jgi:RecJ-like exonuclease
VEPAERDPACLLDPDHQESEPWGGADSGPCTKCARRGTTMFTCATCEARGPDPACPVCGGRVRYEDDCPACGGSGEVDHETRSGVSAFLDEEALYRYLIDHDARLDGSVRLIEMEGALSEQRDFDADEGALLIHPTRIVDVREPDWQLIASLSARVRG